MVLIANSIELSSHFKNIIQNHRECFRLLMEWSDTKFFKSILEENESNFKK